MKKYNQHIGQDIPNACNWQGILKTRNKESHKPIKIGKEALQERGSADGQ